MDIASGGFYWDMTTAADSPELWGCLLTGQLVADTGNIPDSFWYPSRTSLTDYSVTLRGIQTYLNRDLLLYGRITSAPPSTTVWNKIAGYSCQYKTQGTDYADDTDDDGSELRIYEYGEMIASVDLKIYRNVWFDFELTMDGSDITCAIKYDNGDSASVTATSSTYTSGSYGMALFRGYEEGGCYEYYFSSFTYSEL